MSSKKKKSKSAPPEGTIENPFTALETQVLEHSKILESLKDVPSMLLDLKNRMEFVEPSEPGDEGTPDLGEDDGEDEVEKLLSDMKGTSLPTDNQSGTNEEDPLLEILNDSEISREYGEPISNRVAQSFMTCVSRPLSKESSEKMKEKLKVPDNCKSIGVPRVHTEIWSTLPNTTRIGDFKLQQIQAVMSQGMVALAKISDCISTYRDKIPSEVSEEILRHAVHGANLLGMGSQEISQRRRSEIKPVLNSDYAGICSTRVPVTEFLFGDDLNEALKASKTASQVVKRAIFRGRKTQFKPYFNNRQSTSVKPPPLNTFRPPFQTFKRGGGHFRNRQPFQQFQPRPQQK